jgi:hypothetical protein
VRGTLPAAIIVGGWEFVIHSSSVNEAASVGEMGCNGGEGIRTEVTLLEKNSCLPGGSSRVSGVPERTPPFQS